MDGSNTEEVEMNEKYFKFSIPTGHCYVIAGGETMEEAKAIVDEHYKSSNFICDYDLEDLDVDVIGTFIKFKTKFVQCARNQGLRSNY